MARLEIYIPTKKEKNELIQRAKDRGLTPSAYLRELEKEALVRLQGERKVTLMSKRYTEGVCHDGAAILDNGQMITITDILDRLNTGEHLQQKTDQLEGLVEEILWRNASDIEGCKEIKEKLKRIKGE